MTDDTPAPSDNPHVLQDIATMSIDELEQLVLSLRARREAVQQRIDTAKRVSRNAKDHALSFRLEKETTAATKDAARISTLLDKLEARITKIRVTLIEMGEG